MNKEDLIIGVHGNQEMTGGHYNVLSSFGVGLIRGFQNNGVQAYTTKECADKGLTPKLTIGFNVTGHETWAQYMNNGIKNIMWSVDSIFAHNFEAMKNFATNPNFILFSVTPCDKLPLSNYFPTLANTFLPHATDLNLWKRPEGKEIEKDLDIVLFSSIKDYEQQLEELKTLASKPMFDLMMQMYKISIENHQLQFWDIYQSFNKQYNFPNDPNHYVALFRNLSYIIMNVKKSQAIQKLSKFNVKIFGDGPWDKYISGNIEHMGSCNVLESIYITNRAKIILHPHAMQLSLGLHERILNASALETFVLSSESGSIRQVFGDNMGYYNDSNFCDLEEGAQYFLEHNDERTEKAKSAYGIVKQYHTWDARAEQILKMIQIN